MAVQMEFCLLGQLAVRAAGAPMPVRPGKQRIVLATLLLKANQVVPAEELAEMLWGAAPPPSARVTVRNYVKRLRHALADASPSLISTQAGGYLIRVGADELDVTRFEVLLRTAQQAAEAGNWVDAARRSKEALALWRGEPLADVASEVLAQREVPRLTELRLQALETRIGAEVRLGGKADVVAELHRLICLYPVREDLYGLLMLAQYLCGRQAEALTAYQQARRVLVSELGTEPGPTLQDLHVRILRADPALGVPESATYGTPGLTTAVPRQLPAAVPHFVGRAAELELLTRQLEGAAAAKGTVVIAAIGGTAGVGKTALALHWAHQVAARFPDGQLYVNLRGYDPCGTAAAPAEAIRGFLDALGVPPGLIPPTEQAQAGLYRSLLASRRMLIVADNARDEQQVRPLLPASPGSLVLVTSRSQLGGLAASDGARLVTLDMLGHGEAVQLLAARLGAARAAAEPAAIRQIASLCAGLPLALAVAAARVAAHPGFLLAALAGELADAAGRRLDALDVGDSDSNVRAVFSWSTRQLTDEAGLMFQLLGIHPGPDISVPAAASLAGIAEADARRLLRELARAHLIAEHVPGRYAFHDLLRAYAAEQARRTGNRAGRDAATGRVLDHYLHTAACAALLVDPSKEPVALVPPRPGAAVGQPAGYAQAMAWFEEEHQVLLAAVTLAAASGSDTHAWQLPWAMAPFLRARAHGPERATTLRAALAAATRLGDTAAQALSGRLLALACAELGDHDQARSHYASSLGMYQRLGDRLGEAKVQHNLGVLAEQQGEYADALGHAEQALRLFQVIGDKASEAVALNTVGWYHGLRGDYHQARAFGRQALALCAEVGDRWLEGYIWDSLGYAEYHLGNRAEVAACYQRALSIKREVGDRFSEADTLTHFGDAHLAAGELAQAREAWQQALVILQDLQHPDAGQVRAKLASANGNASENQSA